MNAITIAIDKLDKIGPEKVKAELESKGLAPFAVETVMHYLTLAQTKASNQELLQTLRTFFEHSTIGTEGVNELAYLIEACPHIALDVTLARGLDYYTGTILEVKPLNIAMGSIGGGGRYDDLTGLFGVPNIPGVGISFGVDRIYDVMEEKNLFPEAVQTNAVQVMLVNFGETYRNRNREVLNFLRDRNISCELYPDPVKFDKQLKYADKRGVEFVMLIGETELAQNIVALKNFKTGEQSSMPLENVLHVLK
jgi:histidyl-tRNA synthetase